VIEANGLTVLVNGVIEKDAETFTGKLGGRVVAPDRR
jgi:hypothetical protein